MEPFGLLEGVMLGEHGGNLGGTYGALPWSAGGIGGKSPSRSPHSHHLEGCYAHPAGHQEGCPQV